MTITAKTMYAFLAAVTLAVGIATVGVYVHAKLSALEAAL